MAELFSLNVMKASQEERIIRGRNGEPDSKYYVVTLSTGEKSFEVTCGDSNPLSKIETFDRCLKKQMKMIGIQQVVLIV